MSQHPQPLFHLAFPVHDLAQARRFYGELLACAEGRSSEAWVDFNFYGHRVVAHLAPSGNALEFKAFGDLAQVFAR